MPGPPVPGDIAGSPPPVSDTALQPKIDLYGTTMTRGVASNRFDRAVRRCIVRQVENTQQGLNNAINAVLSLGGDVYNHPNFNVGVYSLPLAYAKATRFGPSKVWVDLYYQRGRVTKPTQPPDLIASFRGTHEHTIVYRKTTPLDGEGNPNFDEYGLPNGDLYFDPTQKEEPNGRAWRRPVIKIYVTDIVFGSNPFGNAGLVGALGRVNPDNSYSIGGTIFPPQSLRFDSLDIDWIETYDSQGNRATAFITDYVFSATPGGTGGGWYHHQVFWDGSKWDVVSESEHETWTQNFRFPWEP